MSDSVAVPGSKSLDGEALLKQGQIMSDVQKLRKATQASFSTVLVFPFIFLGLVVGHYLDIINKTFMILCGAMTLSGMMIHMATQEYPSRDGTSQSTIHEIPSGDK
jgi:hypothetical protein